MNRFVIGMALIFPALIFPALIFAALPVTLGWPSLAGAAEGDAKPDKGRGIVAVVNGVPVTSFEFEGFVTRRMLELSQVNAPSVLADNEKEIRKQALDDLVLRHLRLQHCDEVKIDIPDEFIDRRIEGKVEELKRNGARFTSTEEFLDSYEAAFGLHPGEAREHIRQELRLFELEGRFAQRDVYVSPGELRAYYKAHGDQFATDPTHKFRQILIDRDDNDLETILEELEKDQARNVPFEELVKRYSRGPRRTEGGLYEVKDAELGDWKPPVPSIVRGLEPGQTSEPLSSDMWVHIVHLEERVSAERLPFEEAQAVIKQAIAEDRRKRQRKKFENDLRERAYIVIYLDDE